MAGRAVVIETSTDVVNWTAPAITLLGPLYFSDPGSRIFPMRFYRALVQ